MSSKLPSPAPVTFTDIEEKRKRIDSLVKNVLKDLNIPGIAVGFVANGKIVFTEGYGVRDHADPKSQVTPRTLFAIGSCTKAFTTYLLARLVNEHQIAWSDPVIKYVPEFHMDVTIKDLVTHATGLAAHDALWIKSKVPIGAGSQDMAPNLTIDEFMKRLPHLRIACRARQHFLYNNLMFGMAGRVIERVSKQGAWRESVRDLIFEPLGMTRSYCSLEDARLQLNDEDIAKPHRYGDDASSLTTYQDWMVIPEAVEAAASVISSAGDMAKWIQLQLSGKIPYDVHIPHISIGKGFLQTLDSSIFAYALGWFVGDRNGRQFLSHGGQVNGFRSSVVLFPCERMGIVVLANIDSNEDDDPPTNWLAFRIVDILTGLTSSDDSDEQWVTKLEKRVRDVRASFRLDDSAVLAKKQIKQPQDYTGQFEDAGYGVLLVVKNTELVLFYNNIKYRLYQKRGADVFSARSTTPKSYLRSKQFECMFERDSWGHVYACHMNFQSSVPAIRFVKKGWKGLHAPDYLNLYVGVYANSLEQSIRVSLNDTKGVLTLRVRDASTKLFWGVLQPYKKDFFRFGNIVFEFITIKDGPVSKLIIHMGEIVSTLTRKSN